MKIHALALQTMPELRKLLHLTPNSAAVTLPIKYLKELNIKFDDYLEVSLLDTKTIGVRRHAPPEKK